jgi:hypothetical protein
MFSFFSRLLVEYPTYAFTGSILQRIDTDSLGHKHF